VKQDVLLGNAPDQITEAEKIRRLQDIYDRRLALKKPTPGNVDEALEWFQAINALQDEEHELDRRYPGVP